MIVNITIEQYQEGFVVDKKYVCCNEEILIKKLKEVILENKKRNDGLKNYSPPD